MSSSPDFDTDSYGSLPAAGADRPRSRSMPIGIDVAGLSHPGKVRPRNEDHFLIARFGRFLETIDTNLPPEDVETSYGEAGYGMVTADGMGGHAAGDQASRMAIKLLTELVLATPDWILRLDNEADAERVVHRTEKRFEQTSRAMTQEAEQNPDLYGFGTTMTLAMSLGRDLFLFYVGDSRAYLLRGEQLHQLTHDHTCAQLLLDAGVIQPGDIRTHRLRNRLTKLLGGYAGDARPDVLRLTLEAGDCLLLCTDGLTDMVADRSIAETLSAGAPAIDTCQALIDKALDGGGRDNITTIVARYKSFADDV